MKKLISNQERITSVNIILYGVREDKDETENELREADNLEVKELLTNVFGTNQEHIIKGFKAVTERIGKKGEKYRPLKVTFFDEQQKRRLMDNLFRLKTNAPSYKISVTEDYTRKERKKIKEKVVEAKRLNDEESRKDNNFIWRVRGCPRTSQRYHGQIRQNQRLGNNLLVVETYNL